MTNFYQGILINKHDYDEYDEIWTFWCLKKTINFIARGVRKITSKNRFALKIGNYVEIEIFEARLKDKLSKLKKAHIIDEINFLDAKVAKNIQFLFNVLKKINFFNKTLISILIKLTKMWNNYNSMKILNFILFKTLKPLGINPFLKGCYQCFSKKNIVDFNFFDGGYKCFKHSDNKINKIFLKNILLFEKDFEFYIEKVDDNFSNWINYELKKYLRANLLNL